MQVEMALDTTTSLRPLLVGDGPAACANRGDHRYSVSQVLWTSFRVLQPGRQSRSLRSPGKQGLDILARLPQQLEWKVR
jgi:hypothetical protein